MAADAMPAAREAQGPGRVVHPLEPIVAPDAWALVLGTMPSPASRAARFYYGHPRNRFWPVLARVFGESAPQTNEERARLVTSHGLALWDVLASCTICGASDASIHDPVPNDIAALVARAPITHVFCTGTTAARLYARLCERAVGIPATCLPSTSPANARWDMDALVAAYGVLRR